jgi:hypothetical protein
MKRIITAAVIAAFAVLGLSTPAQAAPPEHAAQNNAAYWEAFTPEDDICTKVELPPGVSTYTLPALSGGQVYTLLVLKAGSGAGANTVVLNPVAGVAYDHDTGKELSHIIYCVAGQPSS